MPFDRHVSAVGLLCFLVTAATLRSAWSADRPLPAKVAAKQAEETAKDGAAAYAGGKFDRAAALWLQAWHLDERSPIYLYSAARAELEGGHLEDAAQHFAEFLSRAQGPAGSPPPKALREYVTLAKRYLGEVAIRRSQALEQEAVDASRQGQHAQAAKRFLEAYKIAPDRLFLLLRAGVAADNAGDLPLALQCMRDWLAQAPLQTAERSQVQARADAIASALGVAPTPQPRPDGATAGGANRAGATSAAADKEALHLALGWLQSHLRIYGTVETRSRSENGVYRKSRRLEPIAFATCTVVWDEDEEFQAPDDPPEHNWRRVTLRLDRVQPEGIRVAAIDGSLTAVRLEMPVQAGGLQVQRRVGSAYGEPTETGTLQLVLQRDAAARELQHNLSGLSRLCGGGRSAP